MIRVLIAEDDDSIRSLICMALKKNSYHCEEAENGFKAAKLVESGHFDLALLDIMLPGIDRYDLFNYIKEYSIPVIFVTAKTSVSDRVRGLHMGAEDYIIKPFDISELLSRVENVLRRYKKLDSKIVFGYVVIDTKSHTVTKNSKPVTLTIKEFELLLLFVRNKNIALYRETIYEQVWQELYMGNTRTVDLHVQRLRKKLSLYNSIQSVAINN